MVKLPFRRNQNEDMNPDADTQQGELPVVDQSQEELPQEVQDYYESGRKSRSTSWLLGLATLIVTVLLALALFFGGRWLYRTIAGDDKPESPNTTQNQGNTFQNNNQNNNSGNQNQQGSGSTNQPSQNRPQPTPQPAPAPTPQPRPSTPAPTTTPNTGPGDIVAIAVATAVVSSAAFYVVQLRREN